MKIRHFLLRHTIGLLCIYLYMKISLYIFIHSYTLIYRCLLVILSSSHYGISLIVVIRIVFEPKDVNSFTAIYMCIYPDHIPLLYLYSEVENSRRYIGPNQSEANLCILTAKYMNISGNISLLYLSFAIINSSKI